MGAGGWQTEEGVASTAAAQAAASAREVEADDPLKVRLVPWHCLEE